MLTVSIIPTTGTAAVIFDGNKSPLPDACAEGFRPKAMREFQKTALVRGPYKFVADRFNQLAQWDCTVWHTFATYLACQDFIGHRELLPGSGQIIIFTRTSQSSFTRYYKLGFLETKEPLQQIGVSCQFRYGLILASPYSMTP